MSSIPSNLARVPNLLLANLSLAQIRRTQVDLFRVQSQLSTGRAINGYSDDAAKAAAIGVLDDRLERSSQIKRNLSHAESALNVLDNALEEANEVALQAKSIAATQLAITSSPEERRSQSVIVNQLIQSLLTISGRESPAGHVFGGSAPSRAPVVSFLNGYRFGATGGGLVTDLGDALGVGGIPLTLGGGNPIGATSSRVRGSVDLDPALTAETCLCDLNGARRVGVQTGPIEISINGSERLTVDLSDASTAGDAATRIQAAIRRYEVDNGVTVLGAGGVSFSSGSISIDIAPAATPNTVQFFDVDVGTTAKDLGLTALTPFSFSTSRTLGDDLDPKLTWRSSVSSLGGVTGALGLIRINNLGRSAVIDLSGAATIQDVKNRIEGAGLGLRVEVNAAGNGIDVLSETASGRLEAMSIEEVAGGGSTATRLGIRSLSAETRISDFNDGRGVAIVHGAVNPVTQLSDPTLDIDFVITLGDTAGTQITVDLRPSDMTDVQSVIARINAEAQAQLVAAGLPAGSFTAALSDTTNGIVFQQSPGFASPIRVESRNGSGAAQDLGLLGGTYDAASATLMSDDRAKVRVDNLFTHLIDLRDALQNNDTRGITLAGEKIEESIGRFAETRGLVGGFAQRVQAATRREDDRAVLDETIRSDLRDADFASAATRLTMLQTQLQAALQLTAQSQQRTLLDFLG